MGDFFYSSGFGWSPPFDQDPCKEVSLPVFVFGRAPSPFAIRRNGSWWSSCRDAGLAQWRGIWDPTERWDPSPTQSEPGRLGWQTATRRAPDLRALLCPICSVRTARVAPFVSEGSVLSDEPRS